MVNSKSMAQETSSAGKLCTMTPKASDERDRHRRNTLFIADGIERSGLDAVARDVFLALDLSETDERFSSNYPPDDHYFVGYGENVVLKIFDLHDVKLGYPYCISIDNPTHRKGSAQLPDDAEVLAEALARKGFRLFVPIGPWHHSDWDGSGNEFAV